METESYSSIRFVGGPLDGGTARVADECAVFMQVIPMERILRKDTEFRTALYRRISDAKFQFVGWKSAGDTER